jgi:hypothetical protein
MISSLEMSDWEQERRGTLLDPVGALIYYLCVRGAIAGGHNQIPSSHEIARLLKIREGGNGRRTAINADIQCFWEDLLWLKESQLLFDETPADPKDFGRPMSQHNVNERIQSFYPGFDLHQKRGRLIVPNELVESSIMAARLIALKDLYRFNGRVLPHPLLIEFLQRDLIPDENECYSFLHWANAIRQVDVAPDVSWLPVGKTSRVASLSPSQVFRNHDMYIELRTLDHFSSEPASPLRKQGRLDLHRNTRQFIESLAKRPPATGGGAEGSERSAGNFSSDKS